MKRSENEREELSLDEAKYLLTLHQWRILNLVAKGHTNKQIAECLNISKNTVETHRRNICRKLNIFGPNALLVWSIRQISQTKDGQSELDELD